MDCFAQRTSLNKRGYKLPFLIDADQCRRLSVSESRKGAGGGRSRSILAMFFSHFFVGSLVVRGSKLLLFGGASDDEQGSKEDDYRRGKFHRMSFLKSCCEPTKSQTP
jgi:hypothetical protein